MDEGALYALAAVFSVLLVGLVVLIPVVALTLRFTLKPVLETWIRVRQGASDRESVLQDRRISLLEAELQSMQTAMQRLVEADEFRRQLAEDGAGVRPGAEPGASRIARSE